MAKVIGLGGAFLKATDPKILADWYRDKLGININEHNYIDFPFADAEGKVIKGSNVFSLFKAESPYFAPSQKGAMINFRVDDLLAFLEEIKAKGVELVGDPMIEDYGKFAWVMDPEGNKIELWEP